MENFAIGEPGMVCASCDQLTRIDRVKVTLWLGGELNVVEEVPAHVCDRCKVEYFDPETEARISRLSAAGFPRWQAVREMPVAVFKIYGDKAALAVKSQNEKESVA